MKTSLVQVFSLAGLLSLVNLEFLRPVLSTFYAETWRWKRFDCVAMLKLTIFRMLKRKDRCAVIRYLKLYPDQALLLGFEQELPSPKTVWHFEKIRLGVNGFRELFGETVWHIKTLLQAVGIALARFLCVDSTPIQSCRNDEDPLAEFNPHYALKMYKGDTACCAETGIPVDYDISGGLSYDGHKLPSVLERVEKTLRQKTETVVGDCHYNTFDTQLLAYQKGFRLVGGFEKDHAFDEKGTVEHLMDSYKKYWQDRDYIPPPVSFSHVLRVLARLEPELIGRYFKNQAFIAKDTNEYKELKGKRSLIESEHSAGKERTSLGRVRSPGKENAELHTVLCLLAVLITSPLFLLQQGETTRLMRYGHYEP